MGGTAYSNGVFTLTESGADIWGTADDFHYCYHALAGDGTVTMRVVTLSNDNTWVKAGVMIRESLTPGSKHVFMLCTPTAAKGTAFQYRNNTDGSSVQSAYGPAVIPPYWVRIERLGNLFSAYTSPNGTDWTLVGQVTIAMTANVYCGMALTSHDVNVTSSTTIDNVSINEASPTPPEPPPPPENTMIVESGQSLQTAINNATLGTTILLREGVTYEAISLPNKTSGTGWITIKPYRHSELPAGRIVPEATPQHPGTNLPFALPIIGKVTTAVGAHHYEFIGCKFQHLTYQTSAVLQLGNDLETTSETNLPNYITLDRCWVYGAPPPATPSGGQPTYRGVHMNLRNFVCKKSHLASFWGGGSNEAQALQTANGSGPFLIDDNYLVGAGENFMLGGGGCSTNLPGPGNLTFTNNYCHKPAAWQALSQGTTFMTVKNIFELKFCRGTAGSPNLVENNVFDGNWSDGQTGTPILFTPRNQGGNAPNARVEYVTFRKNIIKNCMTSSTATFSILATDDVDGSTTKTHHITIENNYIDSLLRGLVISQGCDDLTVRHNTWKQSTYYMITFTSPLLNGVVQDQYKSNRMIFRANVLNECLYGFVADYGGGVGMNGWTKHVVDGTLTENVFENHTSLNQTWPAGNVIVAAGSIAASLGADGVATAGSVVRNAVTPADGKPVGYYKDL